MERKLKSKQIKRNISRSLLKSPNVNITAERLTIELYTLNTHHATQLEFHPVETDHLQLTRMTTCTTNPHF